MMYEVMSPKWTTYIFHFLTFSRETVPPERIVILDEKRDPVKGGRVGPLFEESQVKLICRTEGGKLLL